MNTMKKLVIAATVAGFVSAPVAAFAGDKKDPVKTVGCGVATIVLLPVTILTGKGPNC